jgi:hypothetical protein
MMWNEREREREKKELYWWLPCRDVECRCKLVTSYNIKTERTDRPSVGP